MGGAGISPVQQCVHDGQGDIRLQAERSERFQNYGDKAEVPGYILGDANALEGKRAQGLSQKCCVLQKTAESDPFELPAHLEPQRGGKAVYF